MASNSGGGGFQRGGRPAPAPAGGDFFGIAALVFGVGATIMLVAAIAAMYISSKSEDAVEAGAEATMAAALPAVEAAPAIPEGAGIVSEVIDGRPKVSVYFDIGKSDIAAEFADAVVPVKAWLDANPDDRAQLSGFADPTGDAAMNAALAKSRAEAVAAALAAQGVAADRIDLVKPEDVTDADVALTEARRVEITVVGS